MNTRIKDITLQTNIHAKVQTVILATPLAI